MKTSKIVFIGAGSMSFGLSTYRNLFSTQELAGSTLCLVDIDRENLKRMAALARKMNSQCGTSYKIEATTDRREALPGAEFVINSLAVERNRLWKLDFEIPKKYGIRHTLGENGGPGGLFFTLRTIPLILDIARDMEELCPDAYFINYSNPESRIILAMGKYTKIKSIGLCHGVYMGRDDVARIMGMDPHSVDVWAAGLNHFQWLLDIRDKSTGQDLYPLLWEREKAYDPTYLPVTRKLLHAFGKWPTCSDDHLGEYVAYGWEGGEAGYDFEADDAHRVELRKNIEAVLSDKVPVPEDWTKPDEENALKIVTGILHNRSTLIEAGVVYNQGSISNLPSDLAVEVPVMVNGMGIHPISIGVLPEGAAKLLQVQAGVQQLAVEAAVRGSRELTLQALLIDPVVNSISAAQKILDELWEYNEAYIRACV